ncbi:MAG TPA: bifunctional riboflavin kinase/FAD synthetase [Candidatus Cloacimonadota bacterium]|nr:bifunctional riboflavin kinase/FAD synthetase [Candidatus Cloacimonadota bacterium]
MSVLSIGTFDGIHLGHRKLIARVTELSQERHLHSVIVSYNDHPAFVLKQKAEPKMLCPSQIKREELLRLGIKEVAMLSFTEALARMSALDFLEDVLISRWHPRYIVVGYDSHFGRGREGNLDFLKKHALQHHYEVVYVPPLMDNGLPVSSSRIRKQLHEGNLQEANRLLGRSYRLLGRVTPGLARGRQFGFPTANLTLGNPHQLIPRDGIYLSRVYLGNEVFFGLTNIGSSPTVKHTGIIEVETFLIDFEGDIYGQEMQVELLKYLREEKMFANTDKLVSAMQADLAEARALISRGGFGI